MALRRRSAFTLVELLVVIVIIAMLTGLALPALLSAIERGRMTTCSHHQGQISKAIFQYENAKKRLPGYINRLGTTAVGWVPILLPYLDRQDLWEGNGASNLADPDVVMGWRDLIQNDLSNEDDPATVRKQENLEKTFQRLPLLVCPSADTVEDAGLTYVLNVGAACEPAFPFQQYDATTSTNYDTGVFKNLVPTTLDLHDGSGSPKPETTTPSPISLSSIKSTSQRPMLSERQYPVGSKDNNRRWSRYQPYTGATAMASSLTASELTPEYLGFPWLETTGNLITQPFIETKFDADSGERHTIHRGVVIMTFCDGHVAEIAENTECSVYDTSPILK